MFRVDIYIVTKCSSNSKTLGKYGFVCTCAKKSGEIGKIQDTGQIKGTRHETEVKAITEALSRLNQSCEVHIHCEDTFVVNMIDYHISGWAGNDFRKTNGTPIANAEGWQKLWKKMQGHLIRMKKGRHAYSNEIRKTMEDTIPLREVVIMFYICNEALSLLENAAVFVPIPDKLRDVLIQLRDKDTEEDTEGE